MKKVLLLISMLMLNQSVFAQLADRNYADLLTKSITFFEAQACGPNVASHSSFNWRGNCHTSDGQTLGLDLTGGWHDAGDHVKFNFPMAQAVYNLAALYVDYRSVVNSSGNKNLLLKQLRFIGDYMIKCHPSANSYVIQAGTGERDHANWQVPEENTYERRAYLADLNRPNTELACSNAAAFAALSMAFRGQDENYSDELLQHARELYDFGYQNQVSYNSNNQLPDREFVLYDSDNGFQDEIMVGAAWLHRATGEARYKNEADAAFNELDNYVGGWAPAWGDHQYEAAFQLAKTTNEGKYLNPLKRYVVAVADGSEGKYSSGGLWQASAKGNTDGFALPMSLGAASLAYRYAELVGSNNADYNKVRSFAFNQVNYALGDNPRGGSYVVGFGNNFPQITHHRSAHSPNSFNIDSNPTNDTHTITGALVMGPIFDDSYRNVRSDIKYTEPAVGNNAILALTAVQMTKEAGSTPPPSTGNVIVRARGNSGEEQIEIRYQNNRVGNRITLSTTFEEYKVQVNNANGNFKVAFVNDASGRDAFIDWLQVGTTKRQAESRDDNTGAWGNGVCGGGTRTQVLHCNGYINFGTMSTSGSATTGQIVVRAKGDTGTETMELHVNGTKVKTWTNVSTNFTNYTHNNYSGSKNIKVLYTNDGRTSSGADKNLTVDKITVCGQAVQANASGVTRNGCGQGETLWCDGNFDFGTRSCSSSARLASGVENKALLEDSEIWGHLLKSYPNPASNKLVLEGGEHYQMVLYDMTGRSVLEHRDLRGVVDIEVDHILPGLYVMEMRDSENHEVRRRVVIE